MTLNKRGFTLVELMVVVAMIAIIAGAFSTAVAGAQERAKIQKALSEVKVVSQAMLAYENYHELPLKEKESILDASSSLGFLLGQGGTAESGGKIPVLLQAALSSGGALLDPWGTPYRISIRPGNLSYVPGVATGSLTSGFFLPNAYRLGEGER